MNPAILHIPHASTFIPSEERARILLSDAELADEILCMTDWYVDELVSGLPGERVVFPTSRLVCDVERFTGDEEPMAGKGMGAVYERTSKGYLLRAPLGDEERERILARYYRPHHDLLRKIVEQRLNQEGQAFILDLHSFSSKPLPHESSRNPNRPDICLGTSALHTPPGVLTTAIQAFELEGFSVRIDDPFADTLVPAPFYDDGRILSMMVEINRSLYMNENTGERLPGFDDVKKRVVNALQHVLPK